MAASSTDRLPPAGYTIAIVSTFFAPPLAYLSTPRILHLQGGVTLKTLPVLNYPVPLSSSFSLSLTHSLFPPHPSLYPSYTSTILARSVDGIITIPEKCAISEIRVTRHVERSVFEKSLSSLRGRIFSGNVKENSLNF